MTYFSHTYVVIAVNGSILACLHPSDVAFVGWRRRHALGLQYYENQDDVCFDFV